MEGFLFVALLVLNGLFAMAEIALITARRTRLASMAEEGNESAKVATELADEPTKLLSTIQIGLTSIGLLNGIVSEAIWAEPLSQWLNGLGAPLVWARAFSVVFVVACVTYITIVLGELVPKRIAQIAPEEVALLLARPVRWIERVTGPFGKLLTASTDLILNVTTMKRRDVAQQMTEEEIAEVLEEGSESGVIEKEEHELVRNVFQLDDRNVASLMTPRSDVVYLDVEDELETNLRKMVETRHSRFPVVARSLDDIKGIVSAKEIVARYVRGEPIDLEKACTPAHFIPESLSALDVIGMFRQTDEPAAFVLDEYGQTVGMITVQDVLEAITGEFKPDPHEEPMALQREDGSWLFDGRCSIEEVAERLDVGAWPDQERARYNTISGMFIHLLERLPKTGDHVHWLDWRFEVVDMDDKRIDKLLVSRVQVPALQVADVQAA